jgi:hypothetical protein
VPAKECFGLNNVNGLFPEPCTTGKQNEAKTVTKGKQRSLDLSIEYDQLLAQQGIFYNQIGMSGS